MSNIIPNDLELKSLLQNPPLRENFIQYLRTNRMSAPMDLWLEIEEFENIPMDFESERRRKYHAIFEKYFTNDLTSGVTISNRTTKSLSQYEDLFLILPANTYSRVKDELYILLQYSSINSYMKSDMYARFSKGLDTPTSSESSSIPVVVPVKPTRVSPLNVRQTPGQAQAVSSPQKKPEDALRDKVRSRGAMGFLSRFDFSFVCMSLS